MNTTLAILAAIPLATYAALLFAWLLVLARVHLAPASVGLSASRWKAVEVALAAILQEPIDAIKRIGLHARAIISTFKTSRQP